MMMKIEDVNDILNDKRYINVLNIIKYQNLEIYQSSQNSNQQNSPPPRQEKKMKIKKKRGGKVSR